MKVKLGIYIPMYGGWLRGVDEEEEVSFNYAAKVALKAEERGIHSLRVPGLLLNPIKGERAPSNMDDPNSSGNPGGEG